MVRFEIAKVIHEGRLREIEKKRRHHQVDLNAPRFRKRLLLRLGEALVAFGHQLQAYRARQAQAHLNIHGLRVKGEGECV